MYHEEENGAMGFFSMLFTNLEDLIARQKAGTREKVHVAGCLCLCVCVVVKVEGGGKYPLMNCLIEAYSR